MTDDKNNNNNNNKDNKNDNNNKDDDDRSIAEVLVDLVNENSNLFFKDQYETPWIRVHNKDHYELIRIGTDKFKRYMCKVYYDKEGGVPYTEAITGATSVLRAKAEYEGQTIPLSLRVAWSDNSIFYDLTNEKWQCIKITTKGWDVIDETHLPLFMRYNQTPQVLPSKEYSPDILDRFLQLTNVKREENKILVIVYTISLFIPAIQHVALQLHGEKGSAKSMLQIFIKELVDPAKPKLLSIHKDRMEFIQQVAHNYLLFYDNLKYIPKWLSDEVCRAITGAGSSKRVLYSDDEDYVYDYRRCFGFNGINLILTEPDALDRSISIEQERIKPRDRKQEEEMLAKFYELRPQLLGYIFDILVKALQIHTTLNLESLPRMGDFALWCEAIARAMGYKNFEFLSIYNDNIERQNIETVEGSALGQAISRFLVKWSDELDNIPACWFGTTSKFLTELDHIVVEYNIDTGKYWPKAANSLSRKLKVIVSDIREGLGYDIAISRIANGKARGVSVVKIRQISSRSSESSRGENQARNEAKTREGISGPEDTYPRDDIISSRKKGENRAQNRNREGREGSEDIGPISLEHGTTIYRLGHSDKFACHNCRQTGDKWFMGQHKCNGNGKAKSRARAKTAG
jgi:hypothetical protein